MGLTSDFIGEQKHSRDHKSHNGSAPSLTSTALTAPSDRLIPGCCRQKLIIVQELWQNCRLAKCLSYIVVFDGQYSALATSDRP